jgi:hypothetical protein
MRQRYKPRTFHKGSHFATLSTVTLSAIAEGNTDINTLTVKEYLIFSVD